jgi:hypothetical protein
MSALAVKVRCTCHLSEESSRVMFQASTNECATKCVSEANPAAVQSCESGENSTPLIFSLMRALVVERYSRLATKSGVARRLEVNLDSVALSTAKWLMNGHGSAGLELPNEMLT